MSPDDRDPEWCRRGTILCRRLVRGATAEVQGFIKHTDEHAAFLNRAKPATDDQPSSDAATETDSHWRTIPDSWLPIKYGPRSRCCNGDDFSVFMKDRRARRRCAIARCDETLVVQPRRSRTSTEVSSDYGEDFTVQRNASLKICEGQHIGSVGASLPTRRSRRVDAPERH